MVPPQDSAASAARPVEVVATLVASVVDVRVAVGDRVAAGDTLVVVESMKMEMPVVAPVAGVVRTLSVAASEVVEEGDVLAVIDAADAGAASAAR